MYGFVNNFGRRGKSSRYNGSLLLPVLVRVRDVLAIVVVVGVVVDGNAVVDLAPCGRLVVDHVGVGGGGGKGFAVVVVTTKGNATT